MNDFINDTQAYILARQFNFMDSKTVKYEPDDNRQGSPRVMRLCDWRSHSRVLIKYTPDDLPPPE